jgi:hypothetical protein
MKKNVLVYIRRPSFIKTSKIIILLSGIILLGFSSCHPTQGVKYGPPPTGYKQMEKPK